MIVQKSHDPAVYNLLNIINPGSGGLNIQDLDYLLPVNQSPKMLNMMYKNGVFGKRYGQQQFSDKSVQAMTTFKGHLIVQSSDKIYSYSGTTATELLTVTSKPVTMFIFNRILYMLSADGYWQYDGTTAKEVEPYIPDIMIVCNPDGTGGEMTDYNYNMIGAGFRVGFNGDGTSTVYHLPKQKDESGNDLPIDPFDKTKPVGKGNMPVKVIIGTTEHSEADTTPGFTVDRNAYTVTFTTAPASGTDNVFITAYVTNTSYINKILKCKYAVSYGGNNNSHLFLAGGGDSKYYYSDAFDATYFPEMNYAAIGATEDDITGFGLQYNVLIIFKPREIFSVNYAFTTDTLGLEKMVLSSQPVNNEVGCDMPHTIQYIDNRLTWGNTTHGICTLCSTNIVDERNVRAISRNINGGDRENGLIAEPNLKDAIAVDYDGKYILFINHNAYVWDYRNAPFSESLKRTVDDSAKATAWYKWDAIPTVKCACVLGNLYYGGSVAGELYYGGDAINKFTNDLNDFGNAIEAYYQTPLFDFQAFESLKTIKQAFFETRGDTSTKIRITYITDDNPNGEVDPEDIYVPSWLWDNFTWNTFGWSIMRYATTFARKCSIKKVLLFAVLLENNEYNRDLSISGIKFKYTIVKEVK